VTTGRDSPLELVPNHETPTTGIVSCAWCGKPTWDGVLRGLGDDGEIETVIPVDGRLRAQRRSRALNPGEALCNRCWSHEWSVIGETYVETLRTEDRDSCRLNGLAPFDDVQRKAHQMQLEPRQSDEFMCTTCTQLRPIHQRHDGDRCVDCIGATLPVWRDLPKYPAPPRHWWHCRQCREHQLLPQLAQIVNKRDWSVNEMDAFDKALPVLDALFMGLAWPWRGVWQSFADEWMTPCQYCPRTRRGEQWTQREGAHRSCWNDLKRRQRRNHYVAIKSWSEGSNNSHVVHIWDNRIAGEEPSVAAVNGSAGAPLSVLSSHSTA
jgi:hypothetical protein